VSLVDVLPTIAELTGADLDGLVDPLAGHSLVGLCDGADGEEREVVGEYMAEGAVSPIVMIRRGSMKFVRCAADPDQLYDLANDPHELRNLAGEPTHPDVLRGFDGEATRRWDLDALHADVIRDQDRRRLVSAALRVGAYTPWDYTPPTDASQQYMRNHLDLDDVERGARWPR
jgi:choline-sulfatase